MECKGSEFGRRRRFSKDVAMVSAEYDSETVSGSPDACETLENQETQEIRKIVKISKKTYGK